MKDLLKVILLFAVLLAAIPMLTFLKPRDDPESPSKAEAAAFSEVIEPASSGTESVSVTAAADVPPAAESGEDKLRVLDFTSGQVTELPLRDYVIGAVLAEMPAAYGEEALKAQAVAARTYAVRQREKQRLSPDPELLGADISNDSSKYQAYFTPGQAKAFYGDGYDAYYKKAADAADATGSDVLVYEGEPIVAAFHSTSGGKTESAEIVWGSPVDYLVPVESPSDEKSPTYLDEQTFTEAEVKARLETALKDTDFGDDPSEWIKINERSISGTVTEMTAGNAKLTGTEFRKIFSLRSANFTVEYGNGIFTVTTRGSGHGVGMSQYGANAMAEAGSDYKEILLHYYTGAEIVDMEEILGG